MFCQQDAPSAVVLADIAQKPMLAKRRKRSLGAKVPDTASGIQTLETAKLL